MDERQRQTSTKTDRRQVMTKTKDKRWRNNKDRHQVMTKTKDK